jgi:streptogramin lyase
VRPQVEATIDVGSKPCAVAAAAGSVWFTDYGTNRLVRVDPATNRVGGRIATRPGPVWFALAGDELWVADQMGNAVQRIDPAATRITTTVATPGGPLDVGLGGGSLWVPTGSGRMWRVNLDDPRRVTESRWPRGIFVAQPALGSLWLLDFAGRTTWRIAG